MKTSEKTIPNSEKKKTENIFYNPVQNHLHLWSLKVENNNHLILLSSGSSTQYIQKITPKVNYSASHVIDTLHLHVEWYPVKTGWPYHILASISQNNKHINEITAKANRCNVRWPTKRIFLIHEG